MINEQINVLTHISCVLKKHFPQVESRGACGGEMRIGHHRSERLAGEI